jgi:hypothetical protein
VASPASRLLSSPRVKPCVVCGALFPCGGKGGHWRRTCSEECRLRRVRTRVCEVCKQPFTYAIGTGTDRRLCSDQCRLRKTQSRRNAKPLCVVENCRNHSGYTSGICNSCYYRLRRTGTLKRREWKYRSLHSNGYIVVFDAIHTLATRDGWLYEHRKVLFDAIGDGPHTCHWCKRPVQWVKGRCSRGALVPDHLDADKTNNALSNLVPSCNRCNVFRGSFMSWIREHRDDPILRQMFADATTDLTAQPSMLQPVTASTESL